MTIQLLCFIDFIFEVFHALFTLKLNHVQKLISWTGFKTLFLDTILRLLMTNLMQITMRVEIYYSPVGVPEIKKKRYRSTVAEFNIVTKTLLQCLMAPTFNGTFEEYYQFICNFKKKVPHGSNENHWDLKESKRWFQPAARKRSLISIHCQKIFWPT